MSQSGNFSNIYQRLNTAQKRAVDTIEGPVMVVAGPGTGKTQVLAARIANILKKTDTKPRSILALTFTDAAAKEMRQRLVGMIGKTGYYVQISTFHAFCSQVIQSHPEFFPIDRGSQALTDLERYDIFQSLIDETKLEVLKPLNRPYFYLTDMMFAISNLKREGFLPADFRKIVQQEKQAFDLEKDELNKTDKNKWERNISKWRELLLIYLAYQDRLRQSLRFDFDDMISLVVEAFDQEELLLREYQENIHYFLVDEYQDTNTAQNKVVDLLAAYWQEEAASPNIFVVGDPNQAIYRFQGASVENVLGFMKRYPQAEVITLEKGYRCPANLYHAAARLIRQNQLTDLDDELIGLDLTRSLISQKNQKSPIRLYQAPSQTLETVYIAEEIKKLIDKGVSADKIAILYRHNRDIGELQTALSKWGIKYEIDRGDNLLESEPIRQLLNFFQVMADIVAASENELLYEVLRYEWLGMDPVVVMKLARTAGKSRVSIYELIKSNVFNKTDLTPVEVSPVNNLVGQFEMWAAADGNQVFPAWFEQVVNESGYLDWVLNHLQKIDLLNHLNSLFRQVKALAGSRPGLNLGQFLAAIETMRDHGIRLDVEDLNVTQDAVKLATVHRAKGLEWPYVFLVHVLDGKWGNNKVRELLPLPAGLLTNTDLSHKEQNEDERRLFYVGLTRASQQLTITYPATLVDETQSKDVIASMFIEELKTQDELEVELKTVSAPQIASQADDYLAKLLIGSEVVPPTKSETQYFASLVEDLSLSVTALNTYLKDPAEFVQNVLLKVPRAKPEPMAFGSAMHQVLEMIFKELMETQKKPSLDMVNDYFKKSLTKELLTSQDFARRLKYGQEILEKYLAKLEPTQVKPVFIERFFGSGWSKTYLGDIHLTGRIDRVDWLDQAKKTVKVIDYKTGKAKSPNFIEGKIASAKLSPREQSLPESIKGPYKRQLLFYKLLTDLDETFIPTATVGEFDFVEPTASGKLVKRTFELNDEDVADLKALIKEVMAEIRTLQFLKDL